MLNYSSTKPNSDFSNRSRSSNFHVGESSNSTAQVPTTRTNILNDADYFSRMPVHGTTETQTNVNNNDASSDSESDQSDHTNIEGNTTDEEFENEPENDVEGMLQSTQFLSFTYIED